jgi:hypothetical protein
MDGDSNHPPGFAQRTLSDCPRSAVEIIATLGLALILFLFLLFAMLVGGESPQDEGDDHDAKTGMSSL